MTNKRFTAGRVINVLCAICWIIGSILGIIIASISLTVSIEDDHVFDRDSRTYIYVATFSLFLVGSVLQLLKDIVTLQVLRNKCCSCISLIPSVVFVISTSLWFCGSVVFNVGKHQNYYWSHYYKHHHASDTKEASGLIVNAVGAGMLWIGSVMHLVKAYAKATKSVRDTSELWAQVISEIIHLHGSIILLLGSIAYIMAIVVRGGESTIFMAGNIMWIIGFSCVGIARVVQFIHIPQSHIPAVVQHVDPSQEQEQEGLVQPVTYHVIPFNTDVYSVNNNQPVHYDPSMFYQNNLYPAAATTSNHQYTNLDNDNQPRQPIYQRK